MSENEKNKLMIVVLEALDQAILPVMNKMMEDIDTIKSDMGTLKSDMGTLKSDMGTLKNDVGELKEENELDHQEMKKRLDKVEFNTRVYPYDKEHVDKKLVNHENRLLKLELKSR